MRALSVRIMPQSGEAVQASLDHGYTLREVADLIDAAVERGQPASLLTSGNQLVRVDRDTADKISVVEAE